MKDADPDPVQRTPAPLQEAELAAVVAEVMNGGARPALRLLEHIEWLTDELERVREQKDCYRDAAERPAFTGWVGVGGSGGGGARP